MRTMKTGWKFGAVGVVVAASLLVAIPRSEATFPGTNGLIAWSTGSILFTARPDGTQAAPRGAGDNPAWSADGIWLTFDRNGDIWKMLANGAGVSPAHEHQRHRQPAGVQPRRHQDRLRQQPQRPVPHLEGQRRRLQPGGRDHDGVAPRRIRGRLARLVARRPAHRVLPRRPGRRRRGQGHLQRQGRRHRPEAPHQRRGRPRRRRLRQARQPEVVAQRRQGHLRPRGRLQDLHRERRRHRGRRGSAASPAAPPTRPTRPTAPSSSSGWPTGPRAAGCTGSARPPTRWPCW